MFTIDQETNTMTVLRGDTAIFDLNLRNYYFSEGDRVFFTIKRDIRDRKPLVKKMVEEFPVDYVAKFVLSGYDTSIPEGEYVYDIKCILEDGREDTVVAPSKFLVLGGVTDE